MSKPPQRESLLPPLWVMTILGAYGLWWLLSELHEIVVFLVFGYIIAYILDPLLDKLSRRKISRGVGFFLIISVFALFMLLVLLTAIPPFMDDLNQFIDNLPSYLVTLRLKALELVQWVNMRIPGKFSMEEVQSHLTAIPEINSSTIRGILAGFTNFLLGGYSITLAIVNLALLPFVIYYLSLDIDCFHRWVMEAIPRKSRKKWRDIFSEINLNVRAFIVGQSIVCTILFTLYCLGFWIVGLKQWFFLGVVAGFGNLIPYVGTISGLVLSTGLALVTFGSFQYVLLTWTVFAIVQLLEGTVITPKIVGDKVGLSPLLVILSIVVGGKLFGLLGIFLAIPGAAALRVLVHHAYQGLLNRLEV